ncbi:hypothetical protein Tsubulata_034714 [Turnera subulata]|uniref:F-box domain-containing protein n=1 Tax=Turnera subulata TaxID=218843 RepID=A0A9Q0JKP8_9ROSI|nr:hypothetical protein Tsubulata_034714 [Turnera subulata]
MSTLPPKIVILILCWLPVKAILRFRCVSKAWRSLIDSSHFQGLHHAHSLNHRTFLLATVSNNLRCRLKPSANVYSLDDDVKEEEGSTTLVQVRQPQRPFKPHNLSTFTLGSCNGILASRHGNRRLDFWNPLTGKCYDVPTQWCPDRSTVTTLGSDFYYDTCTLTYRVVALVLNYNGNYDLKLCIIPGSISCSGSDGVISPFKTIHTWPSSFGGNFVDPRWPSLCGYFGNLPHYHPEGCFVVKGVAHWLAKVGRQS